MKQGKLNIEEIEEVAKKFFRHKIRYTMKRTVDFEQHLYGLLYDILVLELSIGSQYGEFGASISIGSELYAAGLLGNKISLNNDEKSIRESLQVIDDYCRLLLPDKYLDAYDKAYKKKGLFK